MLQFDFLIFNIWASLAYHISSFLLALLLQSLQKFLIALNLSVLLLPRAHPTVHPSSHVKVKYMFIDNTWYKNTIASLPWVKCQTNITENYMISVYVVSKRAQTLTSLWAPLLFQRITYPGQKWCMKTKKTKTKTPTQDNKECIMLICYASFGLTHYNLAKHANIRRNFQLRFHKGSNYSLLNFNTYIVWASFMGLIEKPLYKIMMMETSDALTHLLLVPHIRVRELDQHWFR